MYHSKLVGIKKEMVAIIEKSNKMMKRVEKLRGTGLSAVSLCFYFRKLEDIAVSSFLPLRSSSWFPHPAILPYRALLFLFTPRSLVPPSLFLYISLERCVSISGATL